MDKRVYFLMIMSFIVGMIEFIIGGILDLIAADLQVPISQAGYLITIFALIFAVLGPLLLVATARVERKRLTLYTLLVFLLGNIVTILSHVYAVVFIGRVITALSAALLNVLCLVLAPSMVEPRYRARAIGLVSMGLSGSLVLGVPIGLLLGNTFGWRAPFIFISILTLLSMAGVFLFMERMEPKPALPLKQQLAALKGRKIIFAHMIPFLFLGGHTVLYAYFTPFLRELLHLDANGLSTVYFIFGIAAVCGGGLGGLFADKFGAKQTMLMVIAIFAAVMFLIPSTTFSFPLFLAVMLVWGTLSWANTPALQSYLIETSPETAEIQQSLSNSALQFGIAFGSFLGGIVIEQTAVKYNGTVGGILIILALIAAMISIYEPKRSEIKAQRESQ